MQIETDNPSEVSELLTVKVYVGGPFALHNYPCTVCRTNHAVLDLGNGIMQPCWDCQQSGYKVVKLKRLHRFFGLHKIGYHR